MNAADSQLALRSALVAALAADPELGSLLGAGSIHDGPPRAAAFPYVSLGRIGSRAVFPGESAGDVHDIHLETLSRGESRDEAVALADAVVRVLMAVPPVPTGHHLVDLTVQSVASQRLKDNRGYRSDIRLRAVTEPQA